MRVIRVDDVEARLGSGRKMNGIGCAQKDGGRQLPIDLSDSLEDFRVGSEPVKGSGLDVHSNLVKQRSVGYGLDRSFAEFAMERGQHFGLSVGYAGYVVGCRERANRRGACIFVI